MTAVEELAQINAEIRRLKAEKKALQDLRNAKVENVKLKISSFADRIKAAHPFAVEAAKIGGRGLVKGAIGLGKGFATGVRAYLNYLDEQDRRRAQDKRIAEGY